MQGNPRTKALYNHSTSVPIFFATLMEVPAVANETVNLFSTLRDLCRSVTQRLDNYRANPQKITLLKDELSIAEQKIDLCLATLQRYCSAITTELLQFELIRMQGMVKTMQRVYERVGELEQSLQPRRPVFKILGRANRTAGAISEQVEIVRKLSSELNDMNEKLKTFAQDNDIFSPDFTSIPNIRVPVYLDFSTKDTMEGETKAKLLERIESARRSMQNPYANVTAVVGVSGMGGVGKTTALIGLAHDADVRRAFSDGGIYFLVVGKDATPGSLVVRLKEIVRRSGGKRKCEEIDTNGSLELAVSTTSSWFSGRKALFICDDLWQTSSCQTGYLNTLVGLLDENPESHMLISTRNNIIASQTSTTRVVFEPRSNTGREARGMFFASADFDETRIIESTCEDLLREILELCDGVPLMLSIAGAQIRLDKRTPEASLKGLIRSLVDGRVSLSERQPGLYPSCFNQAVRASLTAIPNVLEFSEEFVRPWKEYCRNSTKPAGSINNFVTACFEKLCVLPRSARVPGEIIFGIWCLTNKKLGWSVIDSLVDFHLLLEFNDAEGNARFGLHDVLLDFCEKSSQYGKHAQYEVYHREFLNHVWKLCDRESSSTFDTENCNRAAGAFWDVEECQQCRPWWKALSYAEEMPGIGDYLLGNLFRHLKESDRLAEAAGVLSHMGWTKLRVFHGGISALNADFTLVENATRLGSHKEHDRIAYTSAHRGIMKIWDIVKKVWPLIRKHSGALPTHAYGYLLEKENQLPLVEIYLESARDIINCPWLRPQNAFLWIPDSMNNLQAFRAAEWIVDISVMKNSKTLIAVTTKMLFWIDTETMTAAKEKVIRSENDNTNICTVALCEAKEILVFGFNSGDLELRNLRNGEILRVISGGHEGCVRSAALSRDGRMVVSGSNDKTVRVWDAESGAALGEPLRGNEDEVTCVAMSWDGQSVVSGSSDKTVRVWNWESGSAVCEPMRGHEDVVTSVAMSGDGQTVASGSIDRTVRVWDVNKGSAVGEPLRGHEEDVTCIAMSVDGRTIASGSWDNTLRVWDVRSRKLVVEPLRGHEVVVTCVAISSDGRMVFSGSCDKTVRLWNVQSEDTVVQGHEDHLHGHEDELRSVAMSVDGQTVVSGSWDKTLRVWNAESGDAVSEPLRGHVHYVTCVAMSDDGRTVVSGSFDKTVRIWNAENGDAVGEPLNGHENIITSVAVSRAGRTAVSGSADKTVRVWDVVNESAVGEPLRGHEDVVNTVAISVDGQRAVSGSNDKALRLWDVESGNAVGEPLRGHEDVVRCVAMSGDGRLVVSGSHDLSLRVWDAKNGSAVSEPLRGHEGAVASVAISSNGQTIVSGSLDRTIRVWDGRNSEWHWSCSNVCLLPMSWFGFFAYADGDQWSEVMGKLYCSIGLRGTSHIMFELVRP